MVVDRVNKYSFKVVVPIQFVTFSPGDENCSICKRTLLKRTKGFKVTIAFLLAGEERSSKNKKELTLHYVTTIALENNMYEIQGVDI